MYIAIITLIVIISVLLILIVLAQNSKGGGVTAQFGGSSASQMIGAKKTTDLLERITWGLAISLLLLSLSTNLLIDKNSSTRGVESPNLRKAQQSGAVAPTQQDIKVEGKEADNQEGEKASEKETPKEKEEEK